MTAALALDPDDGRFVDYLTPEAEFFPVWICAGDEPVATLTDDIHGKLERAPIQRAEVEWLLAYACRPQAYSPDLRYKAYAALGAGDARYQFDPITPIARRAAIRSCADSAQMLRLIGVDVGGAL